MNKMKQERKRYNQEYYKHNKERIKERARHYYAEHAEECKDRQRKNQKRSNENRRKRRSKDPAFYRDQDKKRLEQFNKKVAQLLGGKCKICGLKVDWYEVYDCHHRDPLEKEYTISWLCHKNWDTVVVPELRKCDLVCRNCHASLEKQVARAKNNKTYNQRYDDQRLDDYKKRCVIYLGGKCQICGLATTEYEKYDFHHVDPGTKEHGIGTLLSKYKKHWNDIVQPELDKCCLLCGNCHRSLHAGRDSGIELTAGPH
jgi:hypothetical protein